MRGRCGFAYVLFRLLGKWLSEGKTNGYPYVLLPNGRASVEEGLIQLKEGLVSAKKLIYKVADAPRIETLRSRWS